MNKLLTIAFGLLLALAVHAADKPYKVYDGNRIYFSSFNSTFISPEIADSYSIVRGKDRGLVNIAVVPADQESGGITALVSGTVSNILQQSQKLDFFEVREGDVVYYLASFKFDNEDSLTFKVTVAADPNKPGHSFTFQKTFYHDDE